MLITLNKLEVMLEYQFRHAQKTKLVDAYKIILSDQPSSNHDSQKLTPGDENVKCCSTVCASIFEEAEGRGNDSKST